MKHPYTFLVLALLPLASAAQDTLDPQNIEVKTDFEPYYAEGEKKLYEAIYHSITYSAEAIANYIEGRVSVSFDVMPDSSLANITILKGVGHGIEEEVVRFLRGIRYVPGKMSGITVKMNVLLDVPVRAH